MKIKEILASLYILGYLLELRVESGNFWKILRFFFPKFGDQKTQKTLKFHQFEG
jgi:hypothetical protein